jgi:hypothetical protein
MGKMGEEQEDASFGWPGSAGTRPVETRLIRRKKSDAAPLA